MPSRPKNRGHKIDTNGQVIGDSQPSSPPVPLIVQLVRSQIETSPANTQVDFTQFNSIEFEQWGNPPMDSPMYMRRLETMIKASLDSLKQFAEKIPGWSDISKEDHTKLLESACLDCFVLRTAYRNEPQDTKIICCDGMAFQIF